ncbi:sensor histidine kinase [Amycolatopsis sp. 195334CR]|uniref:sensor histidine kinase n=1 Tax=Amycolatopsis sp. 195334CR TaxID=2814588 RepID=UPI001A90A06A|nr:histidine kinase [Amycolatopsis sp. 195334CR]MBN6039843.1 sensor histidine kinase [Amycolatopsis sp. 195334CR]
MEERVKRWLAWWDGRPGLLLLDVLVAAGTVFVDLSGGDPADPHPALYVPAVFAAGLALVFRRRWPFVVLLVVAALLPAGTALIPLTVALYSVAARHGVTLVTGAGVVVSLAVQVVLRGWEGLDEVQSVVLMMVVFVVGPVLGGFWMHQRAELLAVLRERAEEAERTRTLLADQAVFAERRRIAREMHDVVAHRVTAVALQAGALSLQAPDERTGRTAETIRSVSAAALDELRGILRVLRDEVPHDGGTAAPSDIGVLASVGELVEEVVATGARVELELPDPLPVVSGEVGRAVYRVVQESLTNAGKHAPHAAVAVRLATVDGKLRVAVVNRLTPRSAGVPGSGYGLLGMRERVELAGGVLEAGPDPAGRFRVCARFPVPEEAG